MAIAHDCVTSCNNQYDFSAVLYCTLFLARALLFRSETDRV